MKQYCRYCAYLCVGDVPYCSVREQTMSDASAKRVNKCKDFGFCEIDAFGETDGYRPKKVKTNDGEQVTIGVKGEQE